MKPRQPFHNLLLMIVPLMAIAIALQAPIDANRHYFQPGREVSVARDVKNNPVVLPIQLVAASVIGFREAVAGLLWVQADGFFHQGKFEPMVPLFRVVTWLDPHQIDVYSTGSWHMAYNFVDSQERADHRYLKPSIAFLHEGIRNNPDVWDLKSSLGFTIHYLKTLDYDTAATWLDKATRDEGCTPTIGHLVAHAYEKGGRLADAEKQWQKVIAKEAKYAKEHPDDFQAQRTVDIARRNYDELLLRKAVRANLASRRRDIGFEASVLKLKPRIFIISGKANLPDGARVEISITDLDRRGEKSKADTVGFSVNQDSTELYETGMHGASVRNGKFLVKYNLTKDLKQYPFKSDKYEVKIWFNPRNADGRTQDVVGWSGEGMTDKRYLDTSTPGLRILKKIIVVNKNDLI